MRDTHCIIFISAWTGKSLAPEQRRHLEMTDPGLSPSAHLNLDKLRSALLAKNLIFQKMIT